MKILDTRKLILIFIVIDILILTLVFFWVNYSNSNLDDSRYENPNSQNYNPTDKAIYKNFNLSTSYLGDSTWSYTLEGTFPNGCYANNYKVNVIVAESYPEQVRIVLEVNDIPDGLICTQALIEVHESGTFSASGEASINFVISNYN